MLLKAITIANLRNEKFIKLIKEGKPLSVTDPNMTRFLMSLDEAVDLVLYAYQNGTQGDIFVQKSPSSTSSTHSHI